MMKTGRRESQVFEKMPAIEDLKPLRDNYNREKKSDLSIEAIKFFI